jgi:hypothetical protein
MALTLATVTGKQSMGSKRFEVVDITPDSSWLAAGESLTKEDLGFQTLDFVSCESAAGFVFRYDRTNSKLLAYYADNNNAADSALIAVPDATDISAAVVRVLVIGTV